MKVIILFVLILLATAFLTLAERKIMAACQRREGPNVVGFAGILQPFVDGLKLIIKEPLFPSNASIMLFTIAPLVGFVFSGISWAIIPLSHNCLLTEFNPAIMFILAVSSLAVFGIILSGWSSSSNYAFLGSLRSAAQMISYEIMISVVILVIISSVSSLNLNEIIIAQKHIWFAIPHWPAFLIFFIAGLAENNRAPFDLPESESELVAGYFTEYSSSSFSLFFLAEYGAMILMSALISMLFLGGWSEEIHYEFIHISLILKILFCLFLFIIIRASLPRYRYDKLMNLCWQGLLPVSFAWFILTVSVIYFFELY